jgi:hypothetical protein
MIPQILELSEAERDGEAVLQDGLSAAKRILQRRCNDPSPFFNKFWSVTCATVTAGIFIALHLICFANGDQSATDIAGLQDLVMLSISLIENSPPTEARHGALIVLRRLVHLYEHVFRTSAHRIINRSALARIVRLVACPSLWDSLSDTEATVRFIFCDNPLDNRVWTGDSPCSEASKQTNTTTTAGDTCQIEEEEGEILGAWEQYSEIGVQNMETVPYFDQLFPSAEFIDTSLPFVDSAMLGDILR